MEWRLVSFCLSPFMAGRIYTLELAANLKK